MQLVVNSHVCCVHPYYYILSKLYSHRSSHYFNAIHKTDPKTIFLFIVILNKRYSFYIVFVYFISQDLEMK